VSLAIPAIGVHTTMINLGLGPDRTLQVPPLTQAGVKEAGWYDRGPAPGQVGPAVIAGHVDSYQGPGVFFRLGALRPGDRIYVTRADGTVAVFMREVGDVHRELYAEHGDLYGDNISPKIERCLAVTDSEVAAATARRAEYERGMLAAIEPFDLLLTPTLGFVAPSAELDEIAVRERFIRFTYPFNLLGWPALALPVGPAEDGLPASIQIVGRPGDDERVLAAGRALEAVLKR